MSQESLARALGGWDEPVDGDQSPSEWGWSTSPTAAPAGWVDSPLWALRGSISPRQRYPEPLKVRQRSLSPYDESRKEKIDKFGRGPRVFIINGHGNTFPDKDGKPALIDGVPVDIFTTVKFARSFGKYMYNCDTLSFFNEPYEYFIERLLRATKGKMDKQTKYNLRDEIYNSLCYTRDITGVIVKKDCKFRCHHKGRKMADMYIMGSGSPFDEAVLCIDPFTGTIEDVHDAFGLRKVDKRLITYPRGRKDIDKAFNIPIRKIERELDDLHSQILMLSHPHSRSAESMDIVRKNREEYDKKYARLNTIKEALRDAVQAPKYRYKVEYQHKYDNVEGGYYIKLSDIIAIAIENGTINPRTDIIVVESCRDFHGKLPSDSKSPGRADSEADSEGGGVKRAYKNKNKRKTIRKLKLSKSRKHSNSP